MHFKAEAIFRVGHFQGWPVELSAPTHSQTEEKLMHAPLLPSLFIHLLDFSWLYLVRYRYLPSHHYLTVTGATFGFVGTGYSFRYCLNTGNGSACRRFCKKQWLKVMPVSILGSVPTGTMLAITVPVCLCMVPGRYVHVYIIHDMCLCNLS